ncbi:MAG TPA: TetR/AcrR family transcriptional regulator C-terminal domain-containing protein [Candidatus Dormibacteraeota bacterium]|nr:TetR/AcrR family transcriptional regulator C-terminal domain-containing protein [Candidatus Dormibacteraeota bacterium]
MGAASGPTAAPAEIRDLLLDDLLSRWHTVLLQAERAPASPPETAPLEFRAPQINAQHFLPGGGIPMGSFARDMGIGERAATAAEESVEAVLADVAARALAYFRQTMPASNPLLDEPEWLRHRQQRVAQLGAGPRRPAALLAAYLRAEQTLGRIRKDADPEAAAALLLGACFHAAFLTAFLDDETRDPEQFARSIAGVLVGGVKSPGFSSAAQNSPASSH